MSVITEPDAQRAPTPDPTEHQGSPSSARPEAPPATGLTPGRIAVTVLTWLLVTVVGVALVLTNVGPLTEQRDQRSLLGQYRDEIRQASNQGFGLAGTETPTTAPAPGAPVGIVDLAEQRVRQVVVEGADPEQTRAGLGHVTGTAAPGQPGNSVVVGRRSLYGGPFGDLADLEEGDQILVTTTQGPSVYEVGHVGQHRVVEPTAGSEDDVVATNQAADAPESTDAAALLPDGDVTVDEVYGPSEDDRLTLVSSASGNPWQSDGATVAVATMDGVAFTPTPQGGRTGDGDGRSGDPDIASALLLATFAYVAAVGGTILMYRRLTWRSAYILSAPVLVAMTIVLAEQVSRSFPAWS